MKAVRVDYFKIVNMELARSQIFGYAYDTGGIDLAIGDVVELPPTPLTAGRNARATVLHLDDGGVTPRQTVIRRLDSWDA